MSEPESDTKVVDKTQDEVDSTTEELSDRQRKFADLANEQASDIDADRLIDLAHKGAEVEAKQAAAADAKQASEEDATWRERENDKKNAAGEDDDEPVTRGEMKRRDEQIKKDGEASRVIQERRFGHDRHAQRFAFHSKEQGEHVEHLVNGYLDKNPTAAIGAVYDFIAVKHGIKLSESAKDKLDQMADVSRSKTPGRAKGGSVSAPEEHPDDWYFTDEATEHFTELYEPSL